MRQYLYKNMAQKICIIGCGTYGAYLLRRVIENYGNQVEITVIEIGDEKTKSESEMGVVAESKESHAAEKGRYFGLGGTSARWGGQVLFFDERDNPTNEADWNTIVDVNNTYRSVVLQKLLGEIPHIETIIEDKGNEKTGIWLKYTKRNVFKGLDKKMLSSVNLIKNTRVTVFNFEDRAIKSVVCNDTEGNKKTIDADVFYLTAGAIESCRLLLAIASDAFAICR